MKKLLMTILISVWLFAGAGCLEMATPVQLETATNQVEKLTTSIDAYQEVVEELADQMKEDNLLSVETIGKITEVQKKVDELQPVVVDAVTAVIEAEYSGDKLMDIVTGVQVANAQTASINPYAPIIDAVTKALLGVLGVGTVLGVKKNSDNKRIVNRVNKVAAESSGTEGKKLNAIVNGA